MTSAVDGVLAAMDNAHQTLNAALPATGADGRMPPATMDDRLRAASASRRALQHPVQAARPDADITADTPAAG
ncbi:MAG: hypothetical protein HXY24_18485 [Rubrivivax sp.]|nr:hypothetical protein [Rubrivivax sp.]